MKKFAIFFIILLCLSLSVWVFSQENYADLELPGGATIKAKVALTGSQKAKGLSGIEKLTDFDAMLFVENEPKQVAFWMKDMLFPLDIIYLDENKMVAQIFLDQKPCGLTCENSVSFSDKIKYVIELRSGDVAKYKIKLDDKIIWTGY